MKAFAQLILRLEESNSIAEKIDLLIQYFKQVESADGTWALWLLLGNRFPKIVGIQSLMDWCQEVSGIPDWLFQESYDLVKDKIETVSLLIANENNISTPKLNYTINTKIIPLNNLNKEERKLIIIEYWSQLDSDSVFIYNKLLTAGFRSGVSLPIIAKALAQIASIPDAVMMHRLNVGFIPVVENYNQLLSGNLSENDTIAPDPFHSITAITNTNFEDNSNLWMAEWNWPGLRVQIIKRSGKLLIWSEKDEWLQGKFPEIESDISTIPFDFVLEGVIIAGNIETPLPIRELNKRINTQQLGIKSISKIPALFIATDILSFNGQDYRKQTLYSRKEQLNLIIQKDLNSVCVAPVFSGFSWHELEGLRNAAKLNHTDGIILKSLNSDYLNEAGKEDWLLWRQEPLKVLAVLTYAQRAQTQSAISYTEFTFGVWKNEELISIAKAAASLSEPELQDLNTFIKENRVEKFGPVHTVKPELVFEISFEGIQQSARHKSGLVLNNPKMVKWCRDINIAEADTLDSLKALL